MIENYLRIILIVTLFFTPFVQSQEKKSHPKKLHGICFGAFRDGESPHTGLLPLPSALAEDVQFAGKLAHKLRTYSVANTAYLIPEFCRKNKIGCYLGAWLGRSAPQNDLEIELLIHLAKRNNPFTEAVIVGNEPLHRNDFSEEQYIKYIRRVKKQCKVPVTAAETWSVWKKHPKLAAEVDFLMIHIYPYWDQVPIDKAAAYTIERIKEIQELYPHKKIILGEFGWPSGGKTRGGAVAGPENQARYFREIIPLLEKLGIEYFYFS